MKLLDTKGRKRTNLVRVYLSDKEQETLNILCENNKLSMSEIIRELIIANQE